MTMIIAFHISNHRDFKHFYLGLIWQHPRKDFPHLLSYTRFLGLMPSIVVPLGSYFTQLKRTPTGIEFIDSANIKVCHLGI